MTDRRRFLRRGLALAGALAAAALLLACGKKAPPLPPLVGSKPRIVELDLRQEGSTVRARFTMPVRAGSETIDYRTRGIELWRREAVAPGEGVTPPQPEPRPQVPGQDPDDAQPGMPVGEFTKSAQLAHSVSGDDLFELLASPSPELVDVVPTELHGKEIEYAIILKTDIKSSGTVSDPRRITPRQPPAPPAGVVASLTEGAIRVSWTPAQDADGKPLPVNVYRAAADTPYGVTPVSAAPVQAPPFDDAEPEPGSTWRYVLRSVVPGAKPPLESDPTPEIAATWKDEFPPAVPSGLRAFVDGARVTLLWTPNDERDLLGYHAWRRADGGEWTLLTATPLSSATFTDETPSASPRREYAVSAVDRATPPNESERSAPVVAEIEAP